MASADTGIPAKNSERQPNSDTSTPPTIGPEIAPAPIIAMYSPIALPRSRSGNTSVISAMLFACTAADANPCAIFTAISISRLFAAPPAAASAANSANPVR